MMSTRILASRVASCVALALAATSARAQCNYGVIQGTYEPHAGWGRSVAMSGNGEVVLVGGSGAADSDGIVRTFAWDGSSWVEGASLEPEPLNEYAAEFGWSVALSYDGNTAAVGAPGDMHEMTGTHKGAVYVFTRDPGTGEWSQQARMVEPNPGANHTFGQAIAISDSGDQLVVGQRNHLDSGKAYIPDSAWVFSRAAGVWAAPVELIGTDLVNADEFGAAVAISPDGSRAVVSALGDGQADGRVFVFRRDGDDWPIEQILDYPEAPEGWDSFGNAVAIDGNLIMVGDAFDDEPEFGTVNSGSVHIFEFDGTEWVRQPKFLRLHEGWWSHYGFGHALALRGDYLLVGCPNGSSPEGDSGAVHIVKRMNGKWTLTGAIYSTDPQEDSQFGWSLAIAGDRADYVIGDPEATVDGIREGRAHFVNAVSAPYDFDVEPASTTFKITIRFMGMPVEIEFSADGSLIGMVMSDCEEGAGSFLLTEVDGSATGDPITFAIPPQVPEPWGNSEVVISDLHFAVAEVGGAAALDDNGTGYLTGYRFEVTGMLAAGGGEATNFVHITNPMFATVQLTGGGGEPFDLQLADLLIMDLPLDVGLGDYNPTLSLQGTVGAASIVDPLPRHALTVIHGTGSGSYAAGEVVPIVANAPMIGQIFDVWTGDTGPVAAPNAASTTVTMPAAAVTVTATYKAATDPVRISAYGEHPAGFRLEVSGTAGSQIAVEACSDLSAPDWTVVYSGALAFDPLEVIVTDPANHSTRFYRVRSP